MRRYLGLAICLAMAGQRPAAAAPCYMTQVRDSSGVILSLDTGRAYETYPGRGRVAAGLWLPLDRVQVCRYGANVDRITNLSLPNSIGILAIELTPP